MATFDLDAACDAMATALAALSTPTGETKGIRTAYGKAPNGAPMLPCAIVFPQDGELILQPQAYNGHHRIDVVFLLSKSQADLNRIETSRQRWLPVLYHAFDSAMALGLNPVVRKTFPLSWEFTEYAYGQQSYDAIVIHFQIDTYETVTLS